MKKGDYQGGIMDEKSREKTKIILASIIVNTEIERRHYMPNNPRKAAIWWMHCQWPIEDQYNLKKNLKAFLQAPQELQAIIMEAGNEHIPWNGDDYETFSLTIEQIRKFRGEY